MAYVTAKLGVTKQIPVLRIERTRNTVAWEVVKSPSLEIFRTKHQSYIYKSSSVALDMEEIRDMEEVSS